MKEAQNFDAEPEQLGSASREDPEENQEARQEFVEPVQYEDNPFRLPSDEEVFVTREAEKRRMQELKEKQRQLKIWEKNTATSQISFKRPKESDIPPAEIKEEADEDKAKKRKALVQAAIDIVGNRIKGSSGKDLYDKKQSMQEFVDQKKEMFLVVKTTKILNDERSNLERMADERENALALADKQMKKNKEEFLNKKKQQADETKERLQELESKIKEKQQREEELLRLEQDETNMRQRNKNNIEREENLWIYKQFHDKVANKEWLAQQPLEVMKKNWVRKKFLSDLSEKERYRKTTVVPEERRVKLEEEFDKGVKDNAIQIENPEQAFQLYFDRPDQLMEIFMLLEEQNLMLIEKNQGLLKEIEEKKASFNTTKARIEKRHSSLYENEQKLLERNREEERRISEQIAIQESKRDHDTIKCYNDFKALISQVYLENIKLQQKAKYSADVPTEKLLEYLTEIEAKINSIRLKVGDKPSAALLKAQNDQKQRIMEAKTAKKNQEKIEKVNQTKLENERRDRERELKKHVGKPIMKRTCVTKKVKKETKKVETTDEEQEFAKYFEI